MFGFDIIDASLLPAMLIAVAAGLLSFASPCVLPVAVPYLAYMGGVSATDLGASGAARRRALLAAFFFVLGLSTVFLILGAALSAIGRLFLQAQGWFVAGAGILVILFGLHFLGVFRIGFLDREARVDAGDRGGTALGAYVLGLSFAFGWTPCLGPILSAVLTLAATEADVARGAVLLALYAAGLGIPFLLLAVLLHRLRPLVDWMKRNARAVEKVSGALLVVVGVMIATGTMTMLSNALLVAFPALGMIG